MFKIFYKESCKCCWHFDLKLIGFGYKDRTYYIYLFGKTIWLNKQNNKVSLYE